MRGITGSIARSLSTIFSGPTKDFARSFSTISDPTKDFFRKIMKNADDHLVSQLRKAADVPLEETDFKEHNRIRRLGDRVSARIDAAYAAEININQADIKNLNGRDKWAIPINIDDREFTLVGSIHKDDDEYVNEIYSSWLFDSTGKIVARCAMNKGEGKEKSHHILLFHCDDGVTADNDKYLIFAVLINKILDKVSGRVDKETSDIRTSCVSGNIDRSVIDRITGDIPYDLGGRAMVSLPDFQRKLKDFIAMGDRVTVRSDELTDHTTISSQTAKMLKDIAAEMVLE